MIAYPTFYDALFKALSAPTMLGAKRVSKHAGGRQQPHDLQARKKAKRRMQDKSRKQQRRFH